MRLIDKIALNRLLALLSNFILGVLKIFSPKSVDDIPVPNPPEVKPDRIPILPWKRKKKNEESN